MRLLICLFLLLCPLLSNFLVAASSTATYRSISGSLRINPQGTFLTYDAGGVFAGTPASAQSATGDTYAVALDTFGGALYIRKFVATTNSWNANWVVASGIFQGSPAAAVDPNGTLWFAARDLYNGYYLNSYTEGVGLGGWIQLGGIFSSDPVLSISRDGVVNIAGKDMWNSIYVITYHPHEEAPFWKFTFLGATARADCRPSILAGSGYEVYIAILDHGGGIWIAHVRDNHFSWVYTGGVVATSPKLAMSPSAIIVAAVSEYSVAWYRKMNLGPAGSWQIPWTAASGVSSLDAAPSVTGNRVYIVVRESSNQLNWFDTQSANWQGPVNGAINSPVSASPAAVTPPPNGEPCSTCFGVWIDNREPAGTATLDRDWSIPPAPDGSFAITGTVVSSLSPACTVTYTITNGRMLPIRGTSDKAKELGLGDSGGAELSYTEANPSPATVPSFCGYQPEQSQNVRVTMTSGGCNTMRGQLRYNSDFRVVSHTLRKECTTPELSPTEFTEDGGWLSDSSYGTYGFFGRVNSNFSFQGRTARELTEDDKPDAPEGADGCWFSGSPFYRSLYPSGGFWFVKDGNRYDVHDQVGFRGNMPPEDPIAYYRRERPQRMLPIPCTITMYQRMVMACNDGPSRAYKDNILTVTIDATTITSSRDGNVKTTVYPY